MKPGIAWKRVVPDDIPLRVDGAEIGAIGTREIDSDEGLGPRQGDAGDTS
jgi:hypothetical protein